MNQPLGAGGNALAAGLAGGGVDVGHAVAHGNGVVLAGLDAVPQPQAAKPAGGSPAGQLYGGGAAQNAVVVHFVGGVVPAAQAVHQGRLLLHLHIAGTQELSNGLGGFRATGSAQAGLGLPLGQGRGVAAAPGVTAGAAVGPGEELLNGLGFFIFRHGHDNGGHCQNQPRQQANARYNQYGK